MKDKNIGGLINKIIIAVISIIILVFALLIGKNILDTISEKKAESANSSVDIEENEDVETEDYYEEEFVIPEDEGSIDLTNEELINITASINDYLIQAYGYAYDFSYSTYERDVDAYTGEQLSTSNLTFNYSARFIYTSSGEEYTGNAFFTVTVDGTDHEVLTDNFQTSLSMIMSAIGDIELNKESEGSANGEIEDETDYEKTEDIEKEIIDAVVNEELIAENESSENDYTENEFNIVID